MNIYDRIINILLEARVEMFIQDRLDEALRHKGTDPRTGARTTSKRAAGRFAKKLADSPGATKNKIFGSEVTLSGDEPGGSFAASTSNAKTKEVTSVRPRSGKQAFVRGADQK